MTSGLTFQLEYAQGLDSFFHESLMSFLNEGLHERVHLVMLLWILRVMFIILEEESVRHPIPCMAIQVVSVFAPRHKHIVQAVVFAEPSVLSHRFLGQNLTIVSIHKGAFTEPQRGRRSIILLMRWYM